MMRTFDLEQRLIQFSISTIDIANIIQSKPIGYHIGNQLLRAGTSAALNYAEAQGGESRRDFIHKMKISLNENNELISIFISSITTAQKNSIKGK